MRSFRTALLLALLAISAAAQAPPFIGPLRIRDLSPISMLRLDFPPAWGVGPEPERAMRIQYSTANVFILSDVAAEFLEDRGADDPLRREEVETLLEAPGDVFLFDGEISIVEAEYVRALAPRTHVQVTWPLHLHGGGFLDRTIEAFHEATGLNTAGRDLLSRNDIHVVARLGGERLVMVDRGTRAGSGDPSIALRHAFTLRDRSALVAEAGVKIPVGDEREYFSSGEADYGVQLSWQKAFEKNALYASASWVWLGGLRIFPSFPVTDTPTVNFAWERRTSPGAWTVVQASWSRSTFDGADDSEMNDDRMLVSIGRRRVLPGGVIAWLALTENVLSYKTTPDLALHAGFGWIPKSLTIGH